MPRFKFTVYHKEVAVYQSDEFDYCNLMTVLNSVIEDIYNFNDKFGDHVIKTWDFNYIIEEVA